LWKKEQHPHTYIESFQIAANLAIVYYFFQSTKWCFLLIRPPKDHFDHNLLNI